MSKKARRAASECETEEGASGDLYLLPERESCTSWYGREVEVVSSSKKIAGFRLYVFERWALSDCGWTLVERTGDERDRLTVSLVRVLEVASRAVSILSCPELYGFELVKTSLGKILVCADIQAMCCRRVCDESLATARPRSISWVASARLWWLKSGDFEKCEKDLLIWLTMSKLGVSGRWLVESTRDTVVPFDDQWALQIPLFYERFRASSKADLLTSLRKIVEDAQIQLSYLAYYGGPTDGRFSAELAQSVWLFQVQWNSSTQDRDPGDGDQPPLEADGCLDERTLACIRKQVKQYQAKLAWLGYEVSGSSRKREKLKSTTVVFQRQVGICSTGVLDSRTRSWVEAVALTAEVGARRRDSTDGARTARTSLGHDGSKIREIRAWSRPAIDIHSLETVGGILSEVERVSRGVKEEVSSQLSYCDVNRERLRSVWLVELSSLSRVPSWESVLERTGREMTLRGYMVCLNVPCIRDSGGPLTLLRYTGKEEDWALAHEMRFKASEVEDEQEGVWWFYACGGGVPQRAVRVRDGVVFVGVESAMRRAEGDQRIWPIADRKVDELLLALRVHLDLARLGCYPDTSGFELGVSAGGREAFRAAYRLEGREGLGAKVRWLVDKIQSGLCALNCLSIDERSEEYGEACASAVAVFRASLKRPSRSMVRAGEMSLELFQTLLAHVSTLKSLLGVSAPDPLRHPESFCAVLSQVMAQHRIDSNVSGADLLASLRAARTRPRSGSSVPVPEGDQSRVASPRRRRVSDTSRGHSHELASFDASQSTPSECPDDESRPRSVDDVKSAEHSSVSSENLPSDANASSDADLHLDQLSATYRHLEARYRVVKTGFSSLRAEISKTRASAEFLRDLSSENQRSLDTFQTEFTNLNRFLHEDEDAIHTLLCYVARLENQIQKIQRRSQKGVMKQIFIWIAIGLLSLLFFLALCIVSLVDLYRAWFDRAPRTAENSSLRSRFQSFGKAQLKKFENSVDNIESDIATLVGLREPSKDA